MHTPWWDRVHRSMWGLSGNADLDAFAQSARRIAGEVVGPLVASGGRSTHHWTAGKAHVLQAMDDAGLTSIVTSSNRDTAVSLGVVVWELAWIDGGAAICSLSGSLSHMIIRDIGTTEQQARYLDNPMRRHGALCLTEPLPGAGADAATLNGRIGVVAWPPGSQPELEVEKRGRFTSHMEFAEFVVAAVDSRDERFAGSCLVILEADDVGLFDRGTPVRKLGHQLSSTTDPAFRLRIPANRILGGYSIEAGAVVPKFSHRAALAAAFRRARPVMGLLTASKLLSVLNAIVTSCQKNDPDGVWPAQLLEVWAAGEAAASLGFSAAHLSDNLDRAEEGRAALDRQASVICPAAKLFSSETAAAMLRMAAAMVGNYSNFEAGTGFVGCKLIDAQLEAVYLGPEAIQRRQISAFMIDQAFLTEFAAWTHEMRRLAGVPGTASLAAAMEFWSWTLDRLRNTRDSRGAAIFREARQSVTFPMADCLCWLLAARALTLGVLTLGSRSGSQWMSTEHRQVDSFYLDLAAIQSAQTGGRVAQICTGLLFGCSPQAELPDDVRQEFAALRANLDASSSGVMLVRERAAEFIRCLDMTALDRVSPASIYFEPPLTPS